MNRNITAIILAAGRGERMKSDIPKVLHPICGRPMLSYVLDVVAALKINKIIVVLGHKHTEVKKILKPGIKVVIQKKLQGSADAVRRSEVWLKNFKGTVLILYADHPLFKKETLKKLIHYHTENKLDATLLTAKLKNPSGYGRILRDKYGSICRIVEEKDADAFQKDIKEINTGCAVFKKTKLFDCLRRVKRNKLKKEYYLTDVIGILSGGGALIDALKVCGLEEAIGINSRLDLAKANKIMQARILEDHMKNGVTIVAPETTFVEWGVQIGRDTRIYPFTVIERGVKIGKHCAIGPFCHLREGTIIEDNVRIGTFAEVVRSKIARDTLAKHFCYLGDARIGRKVNIGAGVVTANFDGKKKNTTIIKDGAFVGSDTVLVAPVKIGKHAVTGAGSVVTRNKNVADYEVVAGVPAKVISKRG